ncbi:MAG TPA: SDR family oxidoreductase [Anaerolineales bacterium]|nr:SDR family oxidoreductase [Anaerolineales bacterium]
MKDKVVLITGATSGIGLPAALDLSRMGACVIVHGRNQERCKAALDRIRAKGGYENIEYATADLSVQSDVRDLARQVISRHNRLDVLINNAGAVYLMRRLSADGIEMTLATNHLASFLLTRLLLPLLEASPSARIVNVASHAHYGNPVDLSNVEMKRGYLPLTAYNRSKFANVLFTYALARRLDGTKITANAMHPGFVATGMGGNNGFLIRPFARLVMSMGITPEDGARTVVYLASSPEVEGISGRYFYLQKSIHSDRRTYDVESQEKLWELSEEKTRVDQSVLT